MRISIIYSLTFFGYAISTVSAFVVPEKTSSYHQQHLQSSFLDDDDDIDHVDVDGSGSSMMATSTELPLYDDVTILPPYPTTTNNNVNIEDLPGILPPVGFFDPLGFASKADDNTLKRYRESEIVHGRYAMLAAVGFPVGEYMTKTDWSTVKGPAITHIAQLAPWNWALLLFIFSFLETVRAQLAFVEPENVPVDQAGLMRSNYIPGDLGFDPLNFKPKRADDLRNMQTKELQHGRLAMLAAAGFMAQEAVDGRTIYEHYIVNYTDI